MRAAARSDGVDVEMGGQVIVVRGLPRVGATAT